MAKIYEGMFLLDNEVVRRSWAGAKSAVTDLIGKHGGSVHSARRWAERRLAYPVRGRRRGSYLLTYYEIPREGIPTLVRDLDLSETVLRYLLLGVEEIPAGERELAAAEMAPDFSPPPPPSEDAPDFEEGEGHAEGPSEAPAAPSEEPAAEAGEPVLAASSSAAPASRREGAKES